MRTRTLVRWLIAPLIIPLFLGTTMATVPQAASAASTPWWDNSDQNGPCQDQDPRFNWALNMGVRGHSDINSEIWYVTKGDDLDHHPGKFGNACIWLELPHASDVLIYRWNVRTGQQWVFASTRKNVTYVHAEGLYGGNKEEQLVTWVTDHYTGQTFGWVSAKLP